jgi:acyl carrier protein
MNKQKKKTKKELLKIFEKHLKLKKNESNRLLKGQINIKLNQYHNWDSLNHASILVEIENKFKISINSKNIQKFNSFISIVKLLKL